MQVDRYLQVLLKGLDQVIGVIRGDKPGLVFNTYGISTHAVEDESFLNEVLQIIDRPAHSGLSERVTYGSLIMPAAFLNCPGGTFVIALVIDGVENTENINAHLGSLFYKGINQIARILAITHQILSPQKHLQLSIGHEFLQLAGPVPGVLAQKAMGYVERRPPPDLHGIELAFVHFGGHPLHILSPHPGGKCGLMAVTKGSVTNLDRGSSLRTA